MDQDQGALLVRAAFGLDDESKAIIEQHGGVIRLESTVGVGTTVSLRLPLALPPSCA